MASVLRLAWPMTIASRDGLAERRYPRTRASARLHVGMKKTAYQNGVRFLLNEFENNTRRVCDCGRFLNQRSHREQKHLG